MPKSKHIIRFFNEDVEVANTTISFEDGTDPQIEIDKIGAIIASSRGYTRALQLPTWTSVKINVEDINYTYNKS